MRAPGIDSLNNFHPCHIKVLTIVNMVHTRHIPAAAAAKSLQSCLTLCNPTDGSPPGSPVPGILQARTLEWVVISFSNAWKWKVKVKTLSHGQLFATPWTAAHQALLPMGFSRQEYWSGVPLPSPIYNAMSTISKLINTSTFSHRHRVCGVCVPVLRSPEIYSLSKFPI